MLISLVHLQPPGGSRHSRGGYIEAKPSTPVDLTAYATNRAYKRIEEQGY
ncbi:MAG TPA: hypothetical protein V6C85_16985 [Allocoleopsis sp.]